MENANLALAIAMAGFVGGHFLLSWGPVRSALAGRLGETAFLGLYSLVSVAFLVWASRAYSLAPRIALWDFGAAGRHLPLAIMPIALMLVVLGLLSRNPTAVGGEKVDLARAASGVFTITRHPFLWGVTLWALAHLAANGDLPSALLFGGMLILALGGMAAIDAKRAARLGEGWKAFAAKTSAIPFAAVARGAAGIDWAGIGIARPVLGLILYAALLYLHPRLFGVAVV